MASPDVEAHQNNVGPDVWKWVAAVEATLLTALLLAAIPALLWALRTPTRTDLDFIRERQNLVLQKLATHDQQIANAVTADANLQAQIVDIKAQLLTPRRR